MTNSSRPTGIVTVVTTTFGTLMIAALAAGILGAIGEGGGMLPRWLITATVVTAANASIALLIAKARGIPVEDKTILYIGLAFFIIFGVAAALGAGVGDLMTEQHNDANLIAIQRTFMTMQIVFCVALLVFVHCMAVQPFLEARDAAKKASGSS